MEDTGTVSQETLFVFVHAWLKQRRGAMFAQLTGKPLTKCKQELENPFSSWPSSREARKRLDVELLEKADGLVRKSIIQLGGVQAVAEKVAY